MAAATKTQNKAMPQANAGLQFLKQIGGGCVGMAFP
jgi:hypothetical protein